MTEQTEAERIVELEEGLAAALEAQKIFINPKVPKALKALAEQTTAAFKLHTAEGKAILLTALRERLDKVMADLRIAGYDKAAPDEKIVKDMGNAFGKDLAELVTREWIRATKEEKELDGLPENMKGFGNEKAVKNIALVAGQNAARTAFGEIYKKAFYEGVALMWGVFAKFKDDVLIANE